jgi:hypothetical protein
VVEKLDAAPAHPAGILAEAPRSKQTVTASHRDCRRCGVVVGLYKISFYCCQEENACFDTILRSVEDHRRMAQHSTQMANDTEAFKSISYVTSIRWEESAAGK